MKEITELERILMRARTYAAGLGGALFLTASAVGVAYADDPQFTSDTMETRVTSPPPNIMILHDNSGSMDWEFMAPEDQGLFSSAYYLWDLGSDDAYGSGAITKAAEWKGQWAGYNGIFYNPNTTYQPWPRWNKMKSTQDSSGQTIGSGSTNYPPFYADLITPRPNPILRNAPLNLHSSFTGTGTTGLSLPNAYIVDDAESTPAFSTAFGTAVTTNTPYKGTGYRRFNTNQTGSNFKASTFTPQFLQGGKYTVWAWWPCATGSDENALIQLTINGTVYKERKSQKATSNNTVRAGYCGEWIPLFSSTTLPDMPAGNTTSLAIIRDSSSTSGSYTLADSVAFVPDGASPTSTVSVKNAHYYMVNDANGNGTPDLGEVYLVNFIWTDSNSNSKVDDGEVRRYYYSVSYDNDTGNHEDALTAAAVSYNPADQGHDAVPDAIQPKIYNDDGSLKGFVSDYNDLQNFANWFSFYQRRELMTKAAVSRTLVQLSNVYMGYKTLWNDNSTGGASQPVLPIKVAQTVDPSVIIDNAGTGFTSSGTWSTATSSQRKPAYGTNSRYTSTSGSTALFTPTITEAGLYDAQAWWPCRAASDKNAKITIVHSSGTKVAYYNQRATGDSAVTEGASCTNTSAATGCCGYWVSLGSYYFNTGTAGSVKIERHSSSTSSSSTAADAVQFVFKGSLNTEKVDRTNDLLDVIYRINSNNGTPLRQTLQKIGQYYDMDDGSTSTGGIGVSPYLTTEKGGSCQQAYTVAMTDGYWNDSGLTPSIGNSDQNRGAPYADGWSDTLADVADYYYNKDLAASLTDEMPVSNYDKIRKQHMVTFSVSFGLNGSIDRADINGDGTPDNPGYADDPYFLDVKTPKPIWPKPTADADTTIDDLWHASVNGHGRFFVANDPDSLVKALTETFADISARKASGASVSVNGDELSSKLLLFQSSYTSGVWVGDVTAYPINSTTGVIDRLNPKWNAQNKVKNQDWSSERNIVTFNGSAGIPFRYSNLTAAQQQALQSSSTAVDYLRGQEITGFRERSFLLGDFVHSAPLLDSAVSPETDGVDNNGNGSVDEHDEVGGTLFVGGNDGMLHAFNAETGIERFAYLPFHAFDYLYDLTKPDYEHRYYVDGRQTVKRINFFAGDQSHDGKDNDYDGCIDITNTGCPVGKLEISNGDDENYSDMVDNNGDGHVDEAGEYKAVTMLIGMLGKGGRGVYALDVSEAESINPELALDENKVASMVKWEYPPVVGTPSYAAVTGDGFDNNGDGAVDEAGEKALISSGDDPDMGYTYGQAVIVRSYKSRYEAYPYENNTYYPERNPWVVVFANGYLSKNGGAILYVVDALTGTLIRKIVADRSGGNGLSSPTVIDVDNDDRADFVYAGDLKGRMWKFDIRDPDPRKWGVFFGKDMYNNPAMKDTNNNIIKRIDYDDVDTSVTPNVRDVPLPLVNIVNRPITTAPDVAFHPSKHGYLVAFGTGKFLGDADIQDKSQQAMYGIWDFGVTAKDYLGNWSETATDNSFTDPLAVSSVNYGSLPFGDVKLLAQKEIDWRTTAYTSLRTLSDYKAQWYASNLCSDLKDNNNDGVVDNESCVPLSASATAAYIPDGKDNDGDGVIDEPGDSDGEPDERQGHVGWYFDLPYLDSSGVLAGERIIKDVIIREGKVIFISMIPGESPCSGGGDSIVHEVSLASGGRLTEAVFDINNDGKIDKNDLIEIDDPKHPGQKIIVPPTGTMQGGILHSPVIVADPNTELNREMKIFSTSAGTTTVVWERKENVGFYYWKEHVPE